MARSRIFSFLSILLVLFAFATSLAAGLKGAATSKILSGYTLALVEPVSVEKGPTTKNFPLGLDLAIQDRTVERLRQKNLFGQVTGLEQPATPGPTVAGKALVVSMNVISFDKGSTAARLLVGAGAGESKITILFVLRDGESGAEVMRFERTAAWSGMGRFGGADTDDAVRGVTNNIVKEFIREIAKNC